MSQPCVAHFSPKSRTTPTHAHHKCCHNLREACVTLCHLRFCKTSTNAAPPIRAARVSKRYQKIWTPKRNQHPSPTQSAPPPLHYPGPSRMPPRNPAAAHHFDVSTFRLFDFSTFRRFRQENHPNLEPPQPTPATSVGTIPRARVSPYVTFGFARFARTPRPRSEPRASASGTRKSGSLLHPTPSVDPISTAASAFSWTLSNAPAQPRRRSPFRRFDVSTFRRFRPQPQPAPAQALTIPPRRFFAYCHLGNRALSDEKRAFYHENAPNH